MLGSRGTPSQFVLYGLKNMCAKFDAFARFVTMFPLTDRTILWFSPGLVLVEKFSLKYFLKSRTCTENLSVNFLYL